MKRLRTIAVVAGLLLYAVVFYAAPLSDIRDDAGRPLSRFAILWQLFWLPDRWLFPNWFGAPAGFSFLDRIPTLVVAASILAWAVVLGWLLGRAIFRRTLKGTVPFSSDENWDSPPLNPSFLLTPLESFVFSTAIALSAISTWVLLLGLFGVMGRFWMFFLPAAVTCVAAGILWQKDRRGERQDEVRAVTDAIRPPLQPRAREQATGDMSPHWLWLGVPFVAMILLAGMLPPLDFDVREYHAQAPKEFFEQGRIVFLPHNVYANMPMGTEMFTLLAMVVAGDWWLGAMAGKTVIAMFTPLCALALLAAGRRVASPTAGIVAALGYLSIPWIVSVASGGFVEGVLCCYLFLAVYALFLWNDWKSLPMLAIGGYFAGAAIATKYPAVLFVLAPLTAWVAVRSVLATMPKRVVRSVTVFLLAAAVGCGLWFGKNWVQTGNPTYPLLYSWFGGETWNAAKDLQWNNVHRPHDFSIATFGKDIGRVLLTSDWLSPLIVPLAALAFIGRVRHPRLRWLLLAYIGFVVAAWWLLTHRIDRFWIPVLPLAALLAGIGACWTAERWWRYALSAMLLIGLSANFLVAGMGPGNSWFVPLDRLRRDSAWIDPWHQYFNTHAPEGRLLLVGDAGVFQLAVPILYNTCFDDCLFEKLVRGKSVAAIRAGFAKEDIAVVYVNWDEIRRYRATYGFTDFVQEGVFDKLVTDGVLEPLPVMEGHAGRAYRVVASPQKPAQTAPPGR